MVCQQYCFVGTLADTKTCNVILMPHTNTQSTSNTCYNIHKQQTTGEETRRQLKQTKSGKTRVISTRAIGHEEGEELEN